MKNAKELIDLVLAAHDGLIKWSQFNTIKAHISMVVSPRA